MKKELFFCLISKEILKVLIRLRPDDTSGLRRDVANGQSLSKFADNPDEYAEIIEENFGISYESGYIKVPRACPWGSIREDNKRRCEMEKKVFAALLFLIFCFARTAEARFEGYNNFDMLKKYSKAYKNTTLEKFKKPSAILPSPVIRANRPNNLPVSRIVNAPGINRQANTIGRIAQPMPLRQVGARVGGAGLPRPIQNNMVRNAPMRIAPVARQPSSAIKQAPIAQGNANFTKAYKGVTTAAGNIMKIFTKKLY